MSDEALVLASQTNLRVVAFDPAQLQESQKQLIHWASQKLAVLSADIEELKVNIEISRKAKWSMVKPKAALRLAEARLQYYGKIKTALEAGYYIVPDFPCDVFAIRTERDTPRPNRHNSDYSNNYNLVPNEGPQLLPAGAGEYQNPEQVVVRKRFDYRDVEGKDKVQYQYEAKEFLEMDFPFSLAKPEVLNATQQAMALKIFDEIGVAPKGVIRSQKRDPMVLGIIKMPKRGSLQKQVTFLVAWFLDTDVL